MKKIELTQKELDKMISEKWKDGYDTGLKHSLFPANHQKALKIHALIKALEEFFEDKYEPMKEDY